MAPACTGALARRGVIKAHWELWSRCNLRCGFCFRTEEQPLDYEPASRVIDILRTGGIRALALAGGDPSLHPDIDRLASHAKSVGLWLEIQTNAHQMRPRFKRALAMADRVCLSLDAPTAEAHDALRGVEGNFVRVLDLARILLGSARRVTIRTVMNQENVDLLHRMVPIIRGLRGLERWTILEFTPVNRGFEARGRYSMDEWVIEAELAKIVGAWEEPPVLDVFRTSQMVDTYFQIASNGRVYGLTQKSLASGRHEYLGGLLESHIAEIAGIIPSLGSHQGGRYGLDIRDD